MWPPLEPVRIISVVDISLGTYVELGSNGRTLSVVTVVSDCSPSAASHTDTLDRLFTLWEEGSGQLKKLPTNAYQIRQPRATIRVSISLFLQRARFHILHALGITAEPPQVFPMERGLCLVRETYSLPERRCVGLVMNCSGELTGR